MPALRSSRGHRRRQAMALLLGPAVMLALFVAGCGSLQLQRFKSHAARGDYAWIAAQRVGCEACSEVCAARHLMRGDACLQLAGGDTPPADVLACAADELEKGLTLNPLWKDPAVHRYYREILCEALGKLQEQQSGDAAAATLERLASAAEALYRVAPESIPAVYYLAEVRRRQNQRLLPGLNAATRIPVCSRLKRTATRVLSIQTAAEASPTAEWARFADRYQRLVFDLGLALKTAGCH